MPEIDGPRLAAANGRARHLVILLHGYGSDGNDLIGLAPHWRQRLPYAAFVAPHAPEPCQMAPMGYQWFAIARLDPAEIAAGVARAAPVLDRFIDRELAKAGLDESALALVGFSQGTMMALNVGLARPRLAAIVGFSGALASPSSLGAARALPPVCLIHGSHDETIPAEATLMAAGAIADAGGVVRWHISEGLGHGIDESGLAIGGAFLADAFAGRLAPLPAAERLKR